ncbi:heparinase II/III family protein [Haloferula chungangensis]|uniref:Heparinase II/III family protein n=1 Tax=Haloferula chungangensis TaxID=1048331 RepID=A0ABW2L8U5_9BACT
MKNALAVLSFAIAVLSTGITHASSDEESTSILNTLEEKHPRLMLKDSALQDLKKRAETDEVLKALIQGVIQKADRRLGEPMLSYSKRGPRLLHVSKACLERVYELGVAWRWTGDRKYASKLEENLLAVCDFPDWNPRHFLDTAEMAHAVGLGYDWIYHYMDPETRALVRHTLITKGLKPGIERYDEGYHHFTYAYNWNQVCNGGLLIAALAVAESHPAISEDLISRALANLPTALASYAPDGVWAEGIAYWNYATEYTAYALTAMETALGSDFGLAKSPGLSTTGYVPLYSVGPTGFYFSYADAGDFRKHRSAPCQFWLSRTFDNPDFADAEHRLISDRNVSPLHVIWYTPPSGNIPTELERDRLLKGEVETALFRSAWNDPDALFVGVKAGYNQAHHGHLDLGNFELDALGVRWARDLGADDYNLPDYWSYREGGMRWTYYRLGSLSHNVPLLAGNNQNANAVAELKRYRSGEPFSFAEIELSEAYSSHASKARRGVALVADRRAALIQDEINVHAPCELLWGMTTDATIELGNADTARLTLEGKTLIARVLSPEGARFAVESAEQDPPQKSNKGVSRLVIRLPEAEGKTTVSVLLSPVWDEGGAVEGVEINALDEW